MRFSVWSVSPPRRIGGCGRCAGLDRTNRIEVFVLAVEFRGFLGPQRFHRADTLAHHVETRFEAGAVILHFLGIPSGPMPNTKRPPESWSRLAMVLARTIGSCSGTRQNGCPDAQVPRRGGGEGQGHKRIMGVGIAARQIAAARIGAARLVGIWVCSQKNTDSSRVPPEHDPVLPVGCRSRWGNRIRRFSLLALPWTNVLPMGEHMGAPCRPSTARSSRLHAVRLNKRRSGV